MTRLQQLAADALERLVGDISEDAYCAGWCMGIECDLWAIVCGGGRGYGMLAISDEQVAELPERRQRKRSCG